LPAHRQSTVLATTAFSFVLLLAPRGAGAHSATVPAAGDGCLASTLCALKQRVGARKGSPAWTPEFCARLADGVLSSARRHDLAPALLVAVMINESDLNENAARVSHPNGGLAKDSGLMGIRCVLSRGRCTNGFVRGMPWRAVMDPLTNLELGAVYLAHYRDGGGRSTATVRVREPDGSIATVTKNIPCPHRDHAYWAHYNHGTHYISTGPARLYPHHVAVLQDALAENIGLDREAVNIRRYTLKALERSDDATAKRYFELTGLIRSASASCPDAPALAARHTPAPAGRL
jgi:hypothetical protein